MRAGVMHYGLWLVVLLVLPVQAADIYVTAEYKPAPHEVGEEKFINKTPCSTRFPAFAPGVRCSTMDAVDIPRVISLGLGSTREILANTSIRNEAHYIGFPAAHNVTLTKAGGGTSYKIKFIPTAVGAEVAHNISSSFAGMSITELGDCNASTMWTSLGQYFYYREIKQHKQQVGGVCYGKGPKQLYGTDIAIFFGYLGYKLDAPNPLTMENGTYTGTLKLSVKPYGDIDFADLHSPTYLTVFFTFTVQHQLKIVFPPGGNKVVLQPPGGWSDWIYRGISNKIPNLTATLPYRMSGNSNVNIWLNCQYPDGEHCMLMNTRNGHKVRFYVMHRNRRMDDAILSSKVKFTLFMTENSVVNDSHSIIFRVDKLALMDMLKNPGSTYKGNVTLIYDAAI